MLEVVFRPISVLVAITWWNTTDFAMLIFFDILLEFFCWFQQFSGRSIWIS